MFQFAVLLQAIRKLLKAKITEIFIKYVMYGLKLLNCILSMLVKNIFCATKRNTDSNIQVTRAVV